MWHVAPPPYFASGLPWAARVQLVVAASALSATYLRTAVTSAKPGAARVALVLPVVLAFLAAPFIFDVHDEMLTRIALVFILSWLGVFKVVALALGRGPLSRASLTLPQLAALLLMPIFPVADNSSHPPEALSKKDGALSETDGARRTEKKQGRLHDDAGGAVAMAVRWCLKMALLVGIVTLMVQQIDLPTIPRHLIFSFGLYSFVGLLMDGPASLLTSAMGLRIIPTFDQPWLSCSLADFWGRRWNVTTSSVLRTLVYDPIVDGQLVALTVRHHRPSRLTRCVGMCVTFLVSGLVHDYILWTIQPQGLLNWKWFAFFTSQGPLMIAEMFIVKFAKARGLRLPWVLQVLLTVSLLLALANPLFFGPVEHDTDTAQRVIDSLHRNFGQVAAAVGAAVGRAGPRGSEL